MWRWSDKRLRFSLLFVTGALIVSNLAGVLNPFLVQHAYALGGADSLLTERDPALAEKLRFDSQKQVFNYDSATSATAVSGSNLMAGPSSSTNGVSVEAYPDATKGVSVTDNTNKVSFKMTPKFKLAAGQKDSNRLVYPLIDSDGWLVYTMSDAGPKEDVVLNSTKKSELNLSYEMDLGEKLEARLESNGSVGIYGNTLFSGDIATGSDKDAALVQKARKNATKNKLLFAIPAPTIKESRESGNLRANYTVDKDILTMHVTGLRAGNYPLTIDPSIYVVTAYQFMYGNNETNINFDVTNKLIKKGRTTGARFDSWQNTQNLPIGSWGSGSVASGGYIYQVGGASFSGTVISTQGASNYVVPAGVTSITVKMWGGGGGGGGGGNAGTGAVGGGSGYMQATLGVGSGQPINNGDTLNAYIGGGGAGGAGDASNNGAGQGGGGGGATTLTRQTGNTLLFNAAGGGGGGGSGNSGTSNGNGGPGGCSTSGSSCNGSAAGSANGGGGGSSTAGGTAGSGGQCTGAAGSLSNGGAGAGYFFGCLTGAGGAGGAASGGAGGVNYNFFGSASGAGGGGAGYYGGGGASSGSGAPSGGGGGGGNYAIGTATAITHTVGGTGQGGTSTARSPGNYTDAYRGNAGNGGIAGTSGGGTGGSGNIGLIVISTNAAGANATPTLNWAQFDTGNGTVTNANPGNGACSGWCTKSAYDMPAARSNFSLVAYNGYLYAMGGNDAFGANPGSTGHKYNNVYITKLGANGEPRYWNPDSDDPATWTSVWYQSSGTSLLPSGAGLINAGAVAYNNKMYWIGGLDDSSSAGAAKNTVYVANILPTGKLGAWTASTSLSSGGPGALYGMSALVYNDSIYILGGSASVSGTNLNTVYYININSDGSLGSNWIQTTSFTTGRINMGGTNAVVWGGYIYITGGCQTTNASGYCTAVLGDTQIASINADGSLDTFSTISGVTESRIGFGMLAWRDNIYVVGGCSSQDTTSGACLGGIQAGIDYGSIPHEGEVSTIANSVASGTAPCTAAAPNYNKNCNFTLTNQNGMVAVVNNYLYVLGGCSSGNCSTTVSGVYMTTLTSAGDLVEYTPNNATCPTGTTNNAGWCQMTTNLPANLAGAAVTVYQGNIYLIGGLTNNTTLANTIYYSSAGANGVLGTWNTTSLSGTGAQSVAYAYATIRANPTSTYSTSPAFMYIIGGCTTQNGQNCSTATAGVYKCLISTSSVVSACSKTANGTQNDLPAARAQTGGATYGNNIYIVGGTNGTTEQNTIYRATFDGNNNISAWTADSKTLPTAVRGQSVFTYNGYLYSIGGVNGTTLQTAINNAKINTDDGSIDSTGWDTSAVAISARMGAPTVSASGYTYIIGGCTAMSSTTTCGSLNQTIQRFRLYNSNSGSPNSWTPSSVSMNTNRAYHGAVALNGYLYVAGGCSSVTGFGTTGCANDTNTVEMATINPDGSLSGNGSGAWCGSTGGGSCPTITNLPSTGYGGTTLVAVGGSLYVIGGRNGSGGSIGGVVRYATPNPSTGAITSWSTATNGLPYSGRNDGSATVWNNRIYYVGGSSSGTGCNSASACSSVFISPTLSSGGDITSAWTVSANSLPIEKGGLALVAYANNLYAIGGSQDNTVFGRPNLSDVVYAPIDVSGGSASVSGDSVGSWTSTTPMPHGLRYASAFAANGYIYVVGGAKDGNGATQCSNTTLVAPISSNTSSGAPTGLGNWVEQGSFYQSTQGATSGSWGSGVTYYDGKAYISGGGCNNAFVVTSGGSGNKNTQQSTLLAQPQVAKYSISFDTDTDVYPSKYVVNGNTTSVGGAAWTFKYRSMTNPLITVPNIPSGNPTGAPGVECSTSQMTDWGRQTTVYPLVLQPPPGSIPTYTALDSSGANTNCARYYYMNFSVDAQQAFGFPENYTNVPTITDISLQYTGAPAKRLLHGRSFVGELQTPLDTPAYP